MAVEVSNVRNEVNASTTEAETALLTRCLDQAEADVAKYVADNELVVGAAEGNVPQAKYDEAVLAAACDAYWLAKAPNGAPNEQYADDEGEVVAAAIRVNRDPLRSVYAILGLYVIPAIG